MEFSKCKNDIFKKHNPKDNKCDNDTTGNNNDDYGNVVKVLKVQKLIFYLSIHQQFTLKLPLSEWEYNVILLRPRWVYVVGEQSEIMALLFGIPTGALDY